MRIGPENWEMVTTSTAGVPHGGMFGDVDRFEPLALEMGLKIGWSRRHECFVIYTEKGTKKTIQMQLRNWQTNMPVPVNERLLGTLKQVWNNHVRMSGQALCNAIKKREEERKRKEAKERYDDLFAAATEVAKDVTRGVQVGVL